MHWEYKCSQLELLFAMGLMYGNKIGLIPAKELMDANYRLKEANETVEQLRRDSKRLKSECELLQQDLSREETMNTTLNSEVGEMVTQLQELSLRYETEKHLADARTQEVTSLQEEGARKDAVIEQFMRERGAAEVPNIAAIDGGSAKLKQELTEMRNQLVSAQAQIHAYKEVLEQVKRDSERKITESRTAFQLEIANLQSSLPSNSGSSEPHALASAQQEISALSQRYEEESASLRSNLVSAASELSTVRKQLSELSLQQNNGSVDVERTRLQAEVNHLQRALAKEQATKAETVKKSVQPNGIWKPIQVAPAEEPKQVKFGEWKLKKTESKFLKTAIEEAKRAEAQAPDSVYKVQYCPAQIKSLYAAEDELPTRVSESSDWSSSEDDL